VQRLHQIADGDLQGKLKAFLEAKQSFANGAAFLPFE
jgi:hypothetical protein